MKTLMHEESIDIPVDRQAAFGVMLTLDPKDFLYSDWLVAPLISIDALTQGAWEYEGARQRLTFADGTVIEETLIRLVPGELVQYEGRGFSQPMLSWVDHASAYFKFSDGPRGLRLTWHYEFHLPEGPLVDLKALALNTLMIKTIYKKVMQKTLQNLLKILTLRTSVAKAA